LRKVGGERRGAKTPLEMRGGGNASSSCGHLKKRHGGEGFSGSRLRFSKRKEKKIKNKSPH